MSFSKDNLNEPNFEKADALKSKERWVLKITEH